MPKEAFNPQQPELVFKWHELSPGAGSWVKQLLNKADDIYTPKHFLGMAGSHAERIVYLRAFAAFIHHALEKVDPNIAFVSKEVRLSDTHLQTHIASKVGLANLPPVTQGSENRYNILVFAQAEGTDDDNYSDGLDYFIKETNRIVVAGDRSPIPSLREYLFPMDRFRV